MSAIQLIVGLGNPGAEYAATRHNAGAWFVDALASQYHESLRVEDKFHGLFARISIKTQRCFLVIPTTYMNDSGVAVAALAKFYKLAISSILVVHDELDFAPGQIRCKVGGGHGGHNGLRSIMQHLHSRDFLRLRIGVGHPGHKDKVTPFVLSRPSSSDRTAIEQAITQGLAIIDDIVTGNMDKATRYLHG